MSVLIHSATKIDAAGIVENFWLLTGAVEAGDAHSIIATGVADSWRENPLTGSADHIIDASGRWLAPGFIDLHGHGGGGHAFDDGAVEILAALKTHRAHGTTRSIISLVANPTEALIESLSVIADLTEQDPLVLGAHLEGPYLARNHRGAHNPEYLQSPDSTEIDRFIAASRGTLRQITIAPELPGAIEAIDRFVAAGVVVAVGHTAADLDLTKQAFDHGASLLTHAFNAMPGIKHREPGPVVAAFDDNRVSIELILDGFHVHPDVARMAFLAAGDRIVLITDAMAAAGSVDGHYRLGTLNVTVNDGKALLSGTDTIAGSTLTQDVALHCAITVAKVDPVLAIASITANPAKALGLDDRLGYLKAGFAADAVVLTKDWSVESVIGNGNIISQP
jgi:N-acetylglucosamine-6-phosphate deacetylase